MRLMEDAKNFVLLGSAGYIAPRHFKAIKETGNNLLASVDRFDSVGIIDSYFPNAAFFVEFERFDRHIDKLKRKGISIDYFTVCTPNYLHDAHIRFGLKHGADVICEKPIVLNPWNVEALQEIEKETGHKVYTILQLRLHPTIVELKKKIENGPKDKIYDVDLTYITSRGKWYYASWKGEESKSGGIATNIGVHFFDMLAWVFGKVKKITLNISSHDRAAGLLELEKARVRWFLSINGETLPSTVKNSGQMTFRSIKINGEDLEFSSGFTDLHTQSYEGIIRKEGFSLAEAKVSIEVVHQIRMQKAIGLSGDFHPFASGEKTLHPFDSNYNKKFYL